MGSLYYEVHMDTFQKQDYNVRWRETCSIGEWMRGHWWDFKDKKKTFTSALPTFPIRGSVDSKILSKHRWHGTLTDYEGQIQNIIYTELPPQKRNIMKGIITLPCHSITQPVD